jgi:hypothetical protein
MMPYFVFLITSQAYNTFYFTFEWSSFGVENISIRFCEKDSNKKG